LSQLATPKSVLREVFGHEEFRGPQEEVIATVLRGENALLLMPTGMGKSLCYQIPAKMNSGLTLVLSPLIALMKDQVDAAVAKGLKAAFINSSLSREEREARYRKLAKGDYELLYVTPERFRKPEFLEALEKNKISIFAVDEAHCISAWGHDFRPDYSRVGEIRETLGSPVTLALTATATPDVQKDIIQQLGLAPESCRTFNHGLERPNLGIEVHEVHGTDEKIRAIVGMRHFHPGPAIVYVSLVQTLRELSDQLDRLGISHLTYHGQLADRERRTSQEKFLASDDALMLATPAFGLGIDKPNVRLVMHGELPSSIEAYYQEIGRAGRDGKQSGCVLLFDPDDIAIQLDFIKWANPEPSFIRGVYQLIERNLDRARAEGFDYLRAQMNFYNKRDFRVETALNLLERYGSLEGARNPRDWQPTGEPEGEYVDQKLFEARLKGQNQKLHEMVLFVRHDGCRMQRVHEYFGSSLEEKCGICDNCKAGANS
jgi:ATP-dependent DNA helicase RecQ